MIWHSSPQEHNTYTDLRAQLVHTVHQAQDCTMYSYEVDHIIITENDKTVVKQQHMSCPKTYYDSILKSCCLHTSMNNDPKTSIDLLI